MTPELCNERIIQSGWKFVAAISGGGQEVIGNLTRNGGMSASLLEAIVPYHPSAFRKLIGGNVDKIVSSAASRAAAMACYLRALEYRNVDKTFGFGCTSSLAKAKDEREGREHRVWMTIQNAKRTLDIDINLKPGRSRQEEELLVSQCIHQALLWGCSQFGDIKNCITPDDGFRLNWSNYDVNIIDVVTGKLDKSCEDASKAILSSACNPFHAGHLAMLEDAGRRLNCLVDIELCVENADKPSLDYLTIEERVKQTKEFIKDSPHAGHIILTNKPLFFDKANLFPGATFIVGDDTYDRIMDPKYYKLGFVDIKQKISDMNIAGSYFLIYPRKGYKSDFGGIEPLAIRVNPNDGYKPSDISSTAIRQGIINNVKP